MFGRFNCGPAGVADFGLPSGLESRVTVRAYRGLEVHLPALEDLVCFKLNAARWTLTQDPSPAFLGELRRVLGLLGVEVPDGDL